MFKRALLIFSCTLLLSACTLSFRNPEADAQAVETIVANMVQTTLQAETAIAAQRTPTETPTPPEPPTATPEPFTETPTATLTPTQDPNDPRLTLTRDPDWHDSFDVDGGYIYTYNTNIGSAGVQDGKFVMTVSEARGYPDWTLAGFNLRNFYLDVVVDVPANCGGQDHYGVFFRAPDPNHGYMLAFSCDGKYRLAVWDGTEFRIILNWTANGAIAGAGGRNRIGIKANGDLISVYANGSLLGGYSDDTYSVGQFGFLVGSAQTPNLAVPFDDVAYWVLP